MRQATIGALLCGALGLATVTGCGHGRTMTHDDRQPSVDLGVGATILRPGQTVPMGASPAGAPGARHPGADPRNLSMIGGAAQDVDRQRQSGTELGTRAAAKQPEVRKGLPGWAKIVVFPFAVAAWPFKKLAEAIGDDPPAQAVPAPAPGSATPGTPAAAPPGAGPHAAPVPLETEETRERARIEAMERELARRSAPPAPPVPTPRDPGAAPSPEPPPAPTIAQELARLQAGIAPRPRAETRGQASAEPTPAGLADRVLDRDGDGRPDLWQYHDAAGRPTRELLDEDRDGAPDRTVLFDPDSGREHRVEEDTNLDGRTDSWIEYRDGEMDRQRRDTDYDGFLDTWSFYRDGALARQEQDLNGDGFRNRVAFYRSGRLVREREDRDGDGRIDRVTFYDADERVARRDEDSDGDGLVDVRSHYQGGRLTRRELLSDAVAPSIEEEELTSAAWSEDGPAERP